MDIIMGLFTGVVGLFFFVLAVFINLLIAYLVIRWAVYHAIAQHYRETAGHRSADARKIADAIVAAQARQQAPATYAPQTVSPYDPRNYAPTPVRPAHQQPHGQFDIVDDREP